MVESYDNDEQSLIVITVMYFDAYLKGRNQNHPSHHPPVFNHSVQPNGKLPAFRPPDLQNHLLINKPPSFNEMRVEHPKPNSSAHIFLSVAKNSNLPPKGTHNNQSRADNNIGNPSVATFSRQPMTDDKKYICHSPIKINNRASSGLPNEEIPHSKFNYRRSESINDLVSNQSFYQSNKNNFSTLRTTLQYQPSSESRPLNSSPLQIRFNPSNAYPNDKVNKVMKKESVEGSRLLSNREQRYEFKDYVPCNSFRENNYETNNQQKPYLYHFETNPKLDNYTSKEYGQPKYDLSLRKFSNEVKKVENAFKPQDAYKSNTYSTLPHAPLQFIKRQSSQQFLKRYSGSKIPQLDKTLDKDIETLKLVHKKSQEVIENEMNKNIYLNQLFEQKGHARGNINEKRGCIEDNHALQQKKDYTEHRRLSIEDRLDYKQIMDQKKELQTKSMNLQKQVEEKKKQLFEKNKELSQKNKTIIDKNKQIQQGISERKVLQQKYLKLQNSQQALRKRLLQLQEESEGIVSKAQVFEKELNDRNHRILQLQSRLKQQEQLTKAQMSQKDTQMQGIQAKCHDLQSRFGQYQKNAMSDKVTIEDLNNKLKQRSQQYQSTQVKLLQQISQIKQQYEQQRNILVTSLKQAIEKLTTKQEEIAIIQNERQSLQRNNAQSRITLQQQIKELRQRNSILLEDLSVLKKQYKQANQFYQSISQQYIQIGQLLQLPSNFKHQHLIFRIKQLLEPPIKPELSPTKQIPRLQQQHFQRRYVQLNRELKKVGSRLAGASMQAQQGGRLLREANSQIFLLNMMNLNEKYRHFLQQSQQ